ncbi:MAG: LytTR family transcriptional regulator [Bacteroidales bacterium]|nr:LytTR family transcriptional regulator [Bacteroidales bacterium]
MKNGRIENITIRILSATFVAVALAVFKPFGLDAWQWQTYVHLVAIWGVGCLLCMFTDLIMEYIVKLPMSFDKGVDYIIRRNFWFQIINTPIVALGICVYRHFVLSNKVEGNMFSAVNFIETVVIIAFCSFAIGLYWRYKFRSKYLFMELEETRQLNEELKAMQEKLLANAAAVADNADSNAKELEQDGMVGEPKPSDKPVARLLTLYGTTNESVTLHIDLLLYIEAMGNYLKVNYLRDGQVHVDTIRATIKQMEETLLPYPIVVRCHRAFLVNIGQLDKFVSHSGSTQLLIKHCNDSIPVSRSHMVHVKEAIKREGS